MSRDKTKKKTKKGVDIDGLGARATIGKSSIDRVKRVGTPPPKHKRQRQRPPKSSAASPDWWGGYEKEESSMAMSERKLQRKAKEIVAKSYGADASVGDWSEKFRGTKLFDAAVKLREDELDTEIKHLEERKKREQKQSSPDPYWEKQDKLRLQKEKLTLQLLKLKLRGHDKEEKTMKDKKSEGADPVTKSLSGLGGFADFFKGEEVEAAVEQDEEDDDNEEVVDDEVEKGEEAEGEDADQEELEADDAESDEEVDETNKSDSVACPHCASDITVEEMREAVSKSKGTGGLGHAGASPKGKNKLNEKVPARTAAAEEKEGFTSGKKNRNGKPHSGTKTPTRGVQGVSRQPNPGNTGSYTGGKHKHKAGVAETPMHKGEKHLFGTPLMTLSKSEGPGSDEEMAKEIARMNGVDPNKFNQQ